MSEELIIRHCSPTLAGLKTGSLFSCHYESGEELLKDVRALNHRLVPRGLRVVPVRISESRALIYVYRPCKLKMYFGQSQVQKILLEYGYDADSPDRCVAKLIQKLHEGKEFPHEIGLFLGYPAEDVRGFIENKAEGFKCCGCWKVYGDESRARKLFAQYRKCTDIYCRQWSQGKSMERLTVVG